MVMTHNLTDSPTTTKLGLCSSLVNKLSAGPVYTLDPNITTVSADAVAPNGTMPSAGTAVTTNIDMFFFNMFSLIKRHFFKMVDWHSTKPCSTLSLKFNDSMWVFGEFIRASVLCLIWVKSLWQPQLSD